MRCEGGIPLLELHMQRLADSADYFGIRYNASALITEITAMADQCANVVSRIRLELNENDGWEVSAAPLETGSLEWQDIIRFRTHSFKRYFSPSQDDQPKLL